MLVGWLLVSLIEYFAWRSLSRRMMRGFEPAVAGVSVGEMAVDDAPPPPPPPPPAPTPPPEEVTVVEPPAAEGSGGGAEGGCVVPAAEEPRRPRPRDRSAFATAEERRVEYRLDPLHLGHAADGLFGRASGMGAGRGRR